MERLFKTSLPPSGRASAEIEDRSNVSSPGVQRPLIIPFNKTTDEGNADSNPISDKIKSKLISRLGMARSTSKT